MSSRQPYVAYLICKRLIERDLDFHPPFRREPEYTKSDIRFEWWRIVNDNDIRHVILTVQCDGSVHFVTHHEIDLHLMHTGRLSHYYNFDVEPDVKHPETLSLDEAIEYIRHFFWAECVR